MKKIRISNPENKKHLPVYGVGPVYCACIIAATVAGILLSVLDVLPSAMVNRCIPWFGNKKQGVKK